MTNSHQPPTPPAVTDEMVAIAMLRYRGDCIHVGWTDGRNLGTDLERIARARTPETATPVPGRLHAAAQEVLEQAGGPADGDGMVYVPGHLMRRLRAALAAAPAPAATDAKLREAVDASKLDKPAPLQADAAGTAVLDEIREERRKQDAKWGQQNHEFPVWLAILQEEIGEASHEFLHAHFESTEKANEHAAKLHVELVQSAAVLAALIECGHRNSWWPRVQAIDSLDAAGGR